jgi:hypothetical protein
MNNAKHIAFLVEIPAIYTDDIDGLREYRGEFESESDFLSNCIGEPRVVRLRTEVAGDKDSDVTEVWGIVREVQLVEPGRGYGPSPTLTDEQLAENGHKLMRDERACEWCQYDDPVSGSSGQEDRS